MAINSPNGASVSDRRQRSTAVDIASAKEYGALSLPMHTTRSTSSCPIKKATFGSRPSWDPASSSKVWWKWTKRCSNEHPLSWTCNACSNCDKVHDGNCERGEEDSKRKSIYTKELTTSTISAACNKFWIGSKSLILKRDKKWRATSKHWNFSKNFKCEPSKPRTKFLKKVYNVFLFYQKSICSFIVCVPRLTQN